MLHVVPLQHVAQLAQFVLCFGQLGLLVAELGAQILFRAGKVFHVKAQHLQGSLESFHFFLIRPQLLSVALLLSG
jgi:hypothetical protein